MDKTFRKKLAEEKLKNVKLMWKYANWEWRSIMIFGILALIYLVYKICIYLIGQV